MYDENQLVKVKWNNTNKDWYESKGYKYTKRYDSFNVLAKDLSPRSNARLKATCDYCGKEYDAYFVVLMEGRKFIQKDCCHDCTGKKASEVSLKKRAIKYIGLAKKECERRGYILLTTIDEYTDVKMDISFDCPKHGTQTMMLDNFIRGHGCKPCSYEERGKNFKHDIEYVIKCIESVNGNKLLNPNDYKDTFERNLNIMCSCGNIFTTSFSNYTKHNVTTCYSCSRKESTGEEKIRKFLEKNKISFIQEKRFDDCRDIKPLPFDFYLTKNNLIIEFDGKQHFEETYGMDYETTKRHDAIKNKYCESNNINLIRIPYWDEDKIEDIIAIKLNLQVKDIVSSHMKV